MLKMTHKHQKSVSGTHAPEVLGQNSMRVAHGQVARCLGGWPWPAERGGGGGGSIFLGRLVDQKPPPQADLHGHNAGGPDLRGSLHLSSPKRWHWEATLPW
jgi:hypothetical protein